jgi:hypothetical protein
MMTWRVPSTTYPPLWERRRTEGMETVTGRGEPHPPLGRDDEDEDEDQRRAWKGEEENEPPPPQGKTRPPTTTNGRDSNHTPPLDRDNNDKDEDQQRGWKPRDEIERSHLRVERCRRRQRRQPMEELEPPQRGKSPCHCGDGSWETHDDNLAEPAGSVLSFSFYFKLSCMIVCI